jgi:hypothetical protein
MFALAAGKIRTGRELRNEVLTTEAKVTLVDGSLAGTILVGLILNAALRWWWADRRRAACSRAMACAKASTHFATDVLQAPGCARTRARRSADADSVKVPEHVAQASPAADLWRHENLS